MTPPTTIKRGTPAFIRANIAFFLAAFATFATLYSVQPLLPIFAEQFGLDAGASSLALSATTAILAIALLLASWVSDRLGRRTLMVWAILLTAGLGLLLPLAPNWTTLIAIRTLIGLTLSGLPAVAMVYLAEEMDPDALGFSMGLYIGGTAIGGMAGRLVSGILADSLGWRPALAILGAAIAIAALIVVLLLPKPHNSARNRLSARDLTRLIALQFRDKGLPWLFLSAFLLMGSFVTLYNYAGFRLALPPFSMSHTAISAIFVVYLLGSFSSAWAGGLAQRLGRRKVFWAMVLTMAVGVFLTIVPSTPVIIAGLAIATIGYFAAHGIASAWVARRAVVGRAQASAIYLFAYYLGSSVLGTLGGYAWVAWGWTGVMLVSGGAIVAAMLVAIRLMALPPLPIAEKPAEPPAGL
ncbi:Permeases of the major facilitator superfamily protein [Devosia sp. LC5]|uniref:MFS transporter n=1 Tax=Devosia sp. LC5 TaxID=1502724 RepID=UPI0004E439DB|nr:MFS transporter [Devosia sp. LC5]KFC67223.1 Permeases of the major facilitator superfamily protein [Devosia sp. LC5]